MGEMTRYTRKDAERAFARFVDAIGGRVAKSYDDKGAYQLDYNATYGGAVVELLLETGGVSHPFGDLRRSPAEFCSAVRFAIDALNMRNSKKGEQVHETAST